MNRLLLGDILLNGLAVIAAGIVGSLAWLLLREQMARRRRRERTRRKSA
jgi:hypothetical protein